jgi:hypothetical protein
LKIRCNDKNRDRGLLKDSPEEAFAIFLGHLWAPACPALWENYRDGALESAASGGLEVFAARGIHRE